MENEGERRPTLEKAQSGAKPKKSATFRKSAALALAAGRASKGKTLGGANNLRKASKKSEGGASEKGEDENEKQKRISTQGTLDDLASETLEDQLYPEEEGEGEGVADFEEEDGAETDVLEEGDTQTSEALEKAKQSVDERKEAAKRDLLDGTTRTKPEYPSWVATIRGYDSEPNLPLSFEEKFEMPKEKLQKFLSTEDLKFCQYEYPELITSELSEMELRFYTFDEDMMNSWKSVFELEKKRYSFFDELFTQGYIVDSMEVPKMPHQDDIPDYFIEAEPSDFVNKIDYGRIVFKTKNMYTGNLVDWHFQGSGKYTWVDGIVYQGEFSQGLMHGKGTITWPDGSIYEGEFVNGAPVFESDSNES